MIETDNNVTFSNSNDIVQEYKLTTNEIRINRFYTEFKDSEKFNTVPTIEYSEKTELDSALSKKNLQNEKILNQIDGYVESFDDEVVKIRFEDETTVAFPRVLFKNEQLLRFGQSVIYCIKQNENGIRYQDFIEAEIIQTEEKKALLSLIDSI